MRGAAARLLARVAGARQPCRPLSAGRALRGGRSASLAAPALTSRDGFLGLLPGIIADICSDPATADMHPAVREHIKKAINYNIVGGKLNRGISVPVTFSLLLPGLPAARLREAALLGWTVEFLQAFFLVADDIMDGSETRRGQPCWFRQEEVGLSAFNDSIILETCVYTVLRQHFRTEACYPRLLEDLLLSSRITTYGQALDLSSAAEYGRVRGRPGSLDPFTMDRYSGIVRYKTSHYSFVLPVHLAMRLAGVQDEGLYQQAADILFDIGHYFQVCDDFLDCYGDPSVTGKVGTDIQDGKCSWLAAAALQRASPDQRRVLEAHYGSWEPEEVARVRAVYEELGVEEMFRDYEEGFSRTARARIDQVEGLPKEVFTVFLDRVYKRTS